MSSGLDTVTVPAGPIAGEPGHFAAHGDIDNAIGVFLTVLQALPSLRWGAVTLASGQAVVTCGVVQPSSLIFLSRQGPAGTLGELAIAEIIAGVSFTIVSSSAGEASSIAYLIIP